MDPLLLKQAQDALSKAKIQLMGQNDSVFFTTLLFSLPQRFDDSQPTAATDGSQILLNPHFFLALTRNEQVFLLLHEAMHVAYLHMLREAGREHTKWNHAGDYVINLQLVERQFHMPANGLLDRQFAGLSTEDVYQRLPDNLPPPPMADLLSGDGDPGAIEQLKGDVQDILVRAALQSKMAGDKPGTIPGDIEIFLDKLLNPKLPWQVILRKWFQHYAKNDYSMKRPNRRFFPQHHLPSLYSTSLISLVAAVDTSASVSDAEFQQCAAELGSVLKMLSPPDITLLHFDTKIRGTDKLRNVNELSRVQFHGRGSTRILPILEYANSKKPQVMLIFTDGEFSWPALVPTHTEILWLIYNNPGFTAPFGRVIHYEV